MISNYRKVLLTASCIAMLVSAYTGSQAAWIMGKAKLAQYLLDMSWSNTLVNGIAQKPWSWADIRTIARLDIPDVSESLIVLSDASGEAMAFGPGLVGGNPQTAATNTLAIGGHRDTHLSFLEHLPIGTIINLETTDSLDLQYQLLDKQIVDTRKYELTISQHTPGLVLITCYPFNASQTGGPLRMVARAILIETDTLNRLDQRPSMVETI